MRCVPADSTRNPHARFSPLRLEGRAKGADMAPETIVPGSRAARTRALREGTASERHRAEPAERRAAGSLVAVATHSAGCATGSTEARTTSTEQRAWLTTRAAVLPK